MHATVQLSVASSRPPCACHVSPSAEGSLTSEQTLVLRMFLGIKVCLTGLSAVMLAVLPGLTMLLSSHLARLPISLGLKVS